MLRASQSAERGVADDYDSPWKEAIEHYFEDFLHFYFPHAHAQIDWRNPPTFLEQELRAVACDAELGRRFVDKLVRVTRVGGSSEWLYVHVEVQGDPQDEFAERMYVYHYRLYDRYRQPVASLAVLADDQTGWRPEEFGYEICGCHLQWHFPVAKLLDWVGSEQRLADSANPFAVVTLAHLATRATRADPGERYLAKWRLVKSLYRRGWERQRVIDLFKVVDWMMRLPDTLAKEFRQNLAQLEQEENMRYVTSIERLAIEEGLEKGLLQGLEKGMQQGMQQGRLEGMRQLLNQMLVRRFGPLPDWAASRVKAANESQIADWTDALFVAGSLESVLGAGSH